MKVNKFKLNIFTNFSEIFYLLKNKKNFIWKIKKN